MSKIRKIDRVFGDLDQLHLDGSLDQLEARLKAGDDLPEGLGNDGEQGHLPTSLRYYRRFLEGGSTPGREHGHAELIARLTATDMEATMTIAIPPALTVSSAPRVYPPLQLGCAPVKRQRYPAKAIVGIAIGKLPGETPKSASAFFGGFGERQAYALLKALVTQGGRIYCLKTEDRGLFQTRPDILVKHGDEVVQIIDTKWNRVNAQIDDPKHGVSQADVYLMAYGRLYGCKRLILLYPHHAGLGERKGRLTANRINASDDWIETATVDVATSLSLPGRLRLLQFATN